MKDQNIDQVLSAVGLQRQMVWKTDTHSPFNELIFETYAPAQTKSEYQQEMDHIYRMSDIIVLHRETGCGFGFRSMRVILEMSSHTRLTKRL